MKIERVRELLAEAAVLIDELRGGKGARQFRRWIRWWDRVSARYRTPR